MAEKKGKLSENNTAINNDERERMLSEIAAFVDEIKNCDAERENLIASRTYWDKIEGKLSNANCTLEMNRNQLQKNLKRAEKSLSSLTGTCELLKIDVDKQRSENRRKIDNEWDEITEKISEYAEKFPQAFNVYSKGNLCKEIAKYREDLNEVSQAIKGLKSFEEQIDKHDDPFAKIIKEIHNILSELKSANDVMKNKREIIEKDIDAKTKETEDIFAYINELKTKLKEDNKETFFGNI